MGRDCRGRGLAPFQARPATICRRDRPARRLDQDPRRAANSPPGSRRTLMTVTLDHVTRTVEGVPHIRDVSLTLESGTLNVLLGPTLSGKTSIMRLLAGHDKPSAGKVLVEGKDDTGIDVRKRTVAM